MLERSSKNTEKPREITGLSKTDQIESDIETRKRDPLGIARLGIAGLALHFALGDVQAQTRVEQESLLTPAQVQTFEAISGLKYQDTSQEFKVSIVREADSGKPYTLFVGQTHLAPFAAGSFLGGRGDRQAATIQSKLYELMKEVTEKRKIDCAFVEGIDDSDQAVIEKQVINQLGAQLDQISKKQALTLEEAIDASNLLNSHNIRLPLINAYLNEKIAVVQKKTLDTLRRFAPENEEAQVLLHLTEGSWVLSEVSLVMNEQGVRDPVKFGATFKLYMEGKIAKICEAERGDLNQEALEVLEKRIFLERMYKEAWDAANEAQRNDPTFIADDKEFVELYEKQQKRGLEPQEQIRFDVLRGKVLKAIRAADHDSKVVTLASQIKMMEAAFQRTGIDAREEYAIRRISQEDDLTKRNGNEPGTSILVYGSDHAFEKAMKEHGKGRGMIKLQVKEK